MQSKQTKVRFKKKKKGKENPGQAEQRDNRLQSAHQCARGRREGPLAPHPVQAQGLRSKSTAGQHSWRRGPRAPFHLPRAMSRSQLSGRDLCLPTCRRGSLQKPGAFGSGRFPWQPVKTSCKPSKGGGWEPDCSSRSVNDSTWGWAAPTPSLPPSQAPPPQPCRPGHPTLSHTYPSCSPLPSTWEICPLFLPPPHRLLARPWPYPAPRSPQFYFSPYSLTSTQQPDDPVQSEQITRITPRRKSTRPSGLQVLSDTGPASQSSASTSHWFFLPFLMKAMLVPPSLTSCLECVSSRG